MSHSEAQFKFAPRGILGISHVDTNCSETAPNPIVDCFHGSQDGHNATRNKQPQRRNPPQSWFWSRFNALKAKIPPLHTDKTSKTKWIQPIDPSSASSWHPKYHPKILPAALAAAGSGCAMLPRLSRRWPLGQLPAMRLPKSSWLLGHMPHTIFSEYPQGAFFGACIHSAEREKKRWRRSQLSGICWGASGLMPPSNVLPYTGRFPHAEE